MRRSVIISILIVYWLAALTSTHWPKEVSPELVGMGLDKVVHFAMYAGLATLLFLAWRAIAVSSRAKQIGSILAIWLIAAGYGAIDELTQPWFSRQCDLWDWVADVSGALVALAICGWVAPRKRPAENSERTGASRR